jgi:hypothetical protein
MYVSIYVCMYVCMYIYMYVCLPATYVVIHTIGEVVIEIQQALI